MSSSETTDRGHRRLAVWLVGVHLVIGLMLGGIAWLFRNESDPNLLLAVVVGFCFAQVGLLGIWAAYANRSLLARFVVTALGVGYLGMLFAVCVDAVEVSIVYLTMFALACLPVTVILVTIQCFGVGLHCHRIKRVVAGRAQFSIRQIMALTLVVACILAIARFSELPIRLHEIVPLLLALVLPFTAVAIAALWGLLGTKRLWIGLVVLLSLAIAASFALARLVSS